MDIGKEGEPYTIEPIQEPVPGKKHAPAPQEPAAPRPVKEPKREKVPA